MRLTSTFKSRVQGFTLVEMAVVLVIVGLLLGGLIVPLTAQMDVRNYADSRKQMEEIREALLGYAVMYKRFPCPAKKVATTTDANYGLEDASMCDKEGVLPWKALGVREIDAWGIPNDQNNPQWIGYWHYRVDANFDVTIANLNPGFASGLEVRDAAGNVLTRTTERPVAIIYSTGKNLKADGENANNDSIYQSDVVLPSFDDLTMWISRPLLMNRMIAAGQLP